MPLCVASWLIPMADQKRMTSVDVARMAGVSQSTVSRTFAGDTRVKPETRERVLAVAKEVGYVPNFIARGLSAQTTNLVGIVMADVASMFYPYVLQEFVRALQKRGKHALVFNVRSDGNADDVLQETLQYQVDALIIAASTVSDEMVEACARMDTPVFLFNRTSPHVNSICVDNYQGGRQIANLFVRNEYERIGLLAGIEGTQTNQQRTSGFLGRLKEHGITPIYEARGDYTYKSGYAAGRELFHSDTPLDAIFCASDAMAIGLMDAARDAGLNVPNDIAVAGFDGVPVTEWAANSLTTIEQPMTALVKTTLDWMDKTLASQTWKTQATRVKLLPGTLMQRRSTAASELIIAE